MANEFPDNGVVGNGLVVYGFYDLQHIQEIAGNRIFCCIPGNLFQQGAGIFFEYGQLINEGSL